jgi:pilus assembly protein CpaF
MTDLKNRIRQILLAESGEMFSREAIDEAQLRQAMMQVVNNLNYREGLNLSENDKKRVIEEMLAEFVGMGPLDPLLRDPAVTEIMVNGPRKIYVERHGRKELSRISLEDENQLKYLVHKLLAPTRRRVDELSPYTDVSLRDGSRVNIVIYPVALDGTTITIRKFLKELKTIDDLVHLGTLDKRMATFLSACARAHVNIIFSGATGAGKTTTLNVLSSLIPKEERIITIEDTAELHLMQEHVVRLEARQTNIEGRGEITIRDLFRNSLRMRPERIILGEIRGAEALDMLQAICSGHRGSLSVLHANSPQEAVYRLETMILTSGIPVSLEIIHRQIAAAINLIVQQEQLLDGARKITRITQVNGIKDGRAALEDIFYFEIDSVSAEGKVKGRWRATGIAPVFYPELRKEGVELSKDIFNKD